MNLQIDYIDEEHLSLLQVVYGEDVKATPCDDEGYYTVTIRKAVLVATESGLYIGGVKFGFSDYGNVIIY